MIDVALHMGTLAAVALTFHRDIAGMVVGGLRLLAGDSRSLDDSLALYVIVATLPVTTGDLLLNGFVETDGQITLLIALTTIGFGVGLWMADRKGKQDDRTLFEGMTFKQRL